MAKREAPAGPPTERLHDKHATRIELVCAAASIDVGAAAGDGKPEKRPTFSIRAYTGGAMQIPGYYRPVVIDLRGLRTAQRVPVLRDHDTTQIVGQADVVKVRASSLDLAGAITGDDEPAQIVLQHARNGFQWAASVGVLVDKMETVEEGAKARVNGMSFTGPLSIVRGGRLGEVSLLAVGADERAAVTVRGDGMSFEEWLETRGTDADKLSKDEQDKLRGEYDLTTAAEQPEVGDGAPPVTAGAKVDPPVVPDVPDPVTVMRASAADESERIAAVQKVCGSGEPELAAKAIREGWTADRAELELLRQKRSVNVSIKGAAGSDTTNKVLECAVRLGSTEPQESVEKGYNEQTLEAADKHRRIGLRGLIQAACALDGVACPPIAASMPEWVRAGFSSTSLAGILSTSANKLLLNAFMNVPSAARVVAKKLSANDFKSHSGYRLGGDATLKKVGPGGELKHGTLTESSFTYQVDTYGEIIALTRQQWINDDLGAFTQIPQRIGRGAALALESAFWTLVLANTDAFFHADNDNYITGASTALGIAGLDEAVETLEEQTDAEDEPILISGRYLVVPPALGAEARRIWASDNLVATGVANSSKRAAATNVYKNLYEPVVVPYLKGAPTAWYLFGDPNDVAAFGVAYLNGAEMPVVEEAALPADCLGRAWRGYLDFGVCQVEPQGAVKSAGA